MYKNIQHSGLKMSSVKTRTAHSRDRWRSLKRKANALLAHLFFASTQKLNNKKTKELNLSNAQNMIK